MRLLLYNDDFGVTHGINEAVERLAAAGVTTAAALRLNGPALSDAMARLRSGLRLEVGVHLNLTEGPPTAPPGKVGPLLGPDGHFRRSFSGYLAALGTPSGRARLVPAIAVELAAQLGAARDLGLTPNHVNGHQHVHMVPAIFETVCEVARRHGVGWVRIPREPLHLPPGLATAFAQAVALNPLKQLLLNRLAYRAFPVARRHGLAAVGWFLGVLGTGSMTVEVVERPLAVLTRCGVASAEVLAHPARIDHPSDGPLRLLLPGYYFAPPRAVELRAWSSPEFQAMLRRHGVERSTHAELSVG